MIIRNAAKCLHCGVTVESKSRHDFVGCECMKSGDDQHGVFVDGGLSYMRHGWTVREEYQDCTEWSADDDNDLGL